jgi:hypothetical protein
MNAPNHLIHQWGIRAIRLKPSERFFSVFILGINPTHCIKQNQKAAKKGIPPIELS